MRGRGKRDEDGEQQGKSGKSEGRETFKGIKGQHTERERRLNDNICREIFQKVKRRSVNMKQKSLRCIC